MANWFRSLKQKFTKCKREGTAGAEEICDEFLKKTNERSVRRPSATRSAIFTGIQDLLAEESVEEVQAVLFKGFFLVICGVLE